MKRPFDGQLGLMDHLGSWPTDTWLPSERQPEERTASQLRERLSTCHHMKNRWLLEEMSVIAEATRKRLYEFDGYESTEDWLAATLGIGFNRACEQVQIALMCAELPKIRQAFADGKITYDHLRALFRVADEHNEERLLELTDGRSVADTFRIAQRVAAVEREAEVLGVDESFLDHYWDKERRCLVVHGELSQDKGALFAKAIDRLAKELPDIRNEDGSRQLMVNKRADALCELASSVLGERGAVPAVLVHVDARALKGAGGLDRDAFSSSPESASSRDGETPGSPAEMAGPDFVTSDVVNKMACDSIVQLVVDDALGAPMGLGRRRRTASPRLWEGLRKRDHGCRWPGCNWNFNLAAHHIVPWTPPHYGPTDYDNLVLLCRAHHDAVEHRGFKILGKPPNITIKAPDGRLITVGPPVRDPSTEDSFIEEFGAVAGHPPPASYGGDP